MKITPSGQIRRDSYNSEKEMMNDWNDRFEDLEIAAAEYEAKKKLKKEKKRLIKVLLKKIDKLL